MATVLQAAARRLGSEAERKASRRLKSENSGSNPLSLEEAEVVKLHLRWMQLLMVVQRLDATMDSDWGVLDMLKRWDSFESYCAYEESFVQETDPAFVHVGDACFQEMEQLTWEDYDWALAHEEGTTWSSMKEGKRQHFITNRRRLLLPASNLSAHGHRMIVQAGVVLQGVVDENLL